MQLTKGIVFTVGGNLDPIVHSLCEQRPRSAAFVCSSLTRANVTTALARAAEACAGWGPRRVEVFEVDDAEDLLQAYLAVQEALRWLRGPCDLAADELRVDYTGGTKSMSAGAVLAAAPDRLRFAYVGGTRRTDGGTGRVVSGHEFMTTPDNPWVALKQQDHLRLLTWIDVAQWKAASNLLNDLLAQAGGKAERRQCSLLKAFVKGLEHWDRFQHREAWKAWEAGRLQEQLTRALKGAGSLKSLLLPAHELLPRLQAVLEGPPPSGPDPLLVDLLENAGRCASRGFLDDAILRVHRTLELAVQRALQALGLDAAEIQPEDVAGSSLRAEFSTRHGCELPWKLGLRDAARLLEDLGPPLGAAVAARLERGGDLSTGLRNQSWLIHGSVKATRGDYKAYRAAVMNALSIDPTSILAWPHFSTDFAQGASR